MVVALGEEVKTTENKINLPRLNQRFRERKIIIDAGGGGGGAGLEPF